MERATGIDKLGMTWIEVLVNESGRTVPASPWLDHPEIYSAFSLHAICNIYIAVISSSEISDIY
jgi:hypothetical protein